MVGESGPGTPEEFLDWAAKDWPLAPIPASDAVSLAGGAAAALIALGLVPESIGQEWLETFKSRVHEVRALKSKDQRVTRASPTSSEAGFPRVATTLPMAAELANVRNLRVLSIEHWPDGEIILRFVARAATRGEWPTRLLDGIALSTSGGDPVRQAEGNLSMRTDEIICGEQRFGLAESQDEEDLILSIGETSHRIVWN